MSSWVSKHLGVRLDKHTLGNLVKNASPALALTPAGLIGTAVASAGGDLLRGKHDAGGIIRGALSNAAIGATGRGIAGHFGVLGQGGAAVPAAPAAAPTGPAASPLDTLDGGAALGAAPAAAPASPGLFSSAVRGTGNFIEHNPTAVGMGLKGVGGIATAGSENRIHNAQARLLEQQAGESDYEFQRRKAQDLAAEPIRRALFGQLATSLGGTQSPVAANPYAPAGV